MPELFYDEAVKIIAANDVEAVRLGLLAQMNNAGLEFLSDGKHSIFELLMKIRDDFDGTEYMQGKKDGLRTALALLGVSDMLSLNRGGGLARERPTMLAPDAATPSSAGEPS